MFEYSTNRLQWLLKQIESGWHLDAPVIERPVYRSALGQTSAFEFVLRHDHGCQVVAIQDGPEVRAFLHERAIESISL